MNIKIFVSNRIDLESENIHSDIYVPVRCGAIFDKRINLHIMGDDTGDNISEKRMSFCELTVQYWAWKNVEADYYGLCHYRRYLTSTDKKFRLAKEERNNGCFAEEYLTSDVLKKYGLDEARMSKFISQYDVIACSPIEARVTNWQAMKMAPEYHDIDDVHKAVSIVKELYPEMATIVDEYMNSKKIRLYNCFIMKKDIFFAYSKWLFSILFKLEKKIDMSTYGIQKYRTPGTIGERLFGIYCLYLSKQSNIKFRNQPLLFIEYPEKREILEPYFNETQVTIVSNFNDNYASVFSVFLLSALDYINSERNYEFIILGSDFTSEHKEYLEKIVESYKNVHISFCDPFSFLNGVELFVAHPEYSKDLYTRTIIPFILKKYKKVIVVDADTVCKNDLGFLYDVNLEGKTIGAVKDVIYGGYLNGGVPDAYEYTTEKLKLTNPYNYCNTGVLVIDCVLYLSLIHISEPTRP